MHRFHHCPSFLVRRRYCRPIGFGPTYKFPKKKKKKTQKNSKFSASNELPLKSRFISIVLKTAKIRSRVYLLNDKQISLASERDGAAVFQRRAIYSPDDDWNGKINLNKTEIERKGSISNKVMNGPRLFSFVFVVSQRGTASISFRSTLFFVVNVSFLFFCLRSFSLCDASSVPFQVFIFFHFGFFRTVSFEKQKKTIGV